MPKRRNIILGMGALAMGSGAVVTQAAFSGNVVSPSADMQVIADALRIQPLSQSDSSVSFESSVSSADSFTRDQLPRLEVSENTANDSLGLSLGAGTGVAHTFGGSGTEPLEIVNDTSTSYDVKINYADDSTKSSADNWGYGADVNDSTASSNDPSSTNQLSYERVNGIFIFETSGNQDTSATQISPSGTNVEGTTVTLAAGESASILVKVDTTSSLDGQSDTGAINSAIGTGASSPWGTGNGWLDLLDTVYVEAEETP